jgi:hypothetical protein
MNRSNLLGKCAIISTCLAILSVGFYFLNCYVVWRMNSTSSTTTAIVGTRAGSVLLETGSGTSSNRTPGTTWDGRLDVNSFSTRYLWHFRFVNQPAGGGRHLLLLFPIWCVTLFFLVTPGIWLFKRRRTVKGFEVIPLATPAQPAPNESITAPTPTGAKSMAFNLGRLCRNIWTR